MAKIPPKFTPIKFSPFPHDMVNRTLGTELEPGDVYFSGVAQQHVWDEHPNDYPLIVPRIREVILDPSWVGQAPRRSNSIEFVRRLASADAGSPENVKRVMALAAVSIILDEWGSYRVQSVYTISEAKVEARRAKNHLIIPK